MKIVVRVKTRAKRPGIMKTSESHYTVMVAEEPKDGKANDAVLEALAKYFNVKKNMIILEVGEKSNVKEFLIQH